MDFDKLPIVQEIDEELANEKFQDRRHGWSGTYSSGCRGPMCTKAARDRKPTRRQTAARGLDPYIDSKIREHWIDYEITQIRAGKPVTIMALEVVIPPEDEEESASA